MARVKSNRPRGYFRGESSDKQTQAMGPTAGGQRRWREAKLEHFRGPSGLVFCLVPGFGSAFIFRDFGGCPLIPNNFSASKVVLYSWPFQGPWPSIGGRKTWAGWRMPAPRLSMQVTFAIHLQIHLYQGKRGKGAPSPSLWQGVVGGNHWRQRQLVCPPPVAWVRALRAPSA